MPILKRSKIPACFFIVALVAGCAGRQETQTSQPDPAAMQQVITAADRATAAADRATIAADRAEQAAQRADAAATRADQSFRTGLKK